MNNVLFRCLWPFTISFKPTSHTHLTNGLKNQNLVQVEAYCECMHETRLVMEQGSDVDFNFLLLFLIRNKVC